MRTNPRNYRRRRDDGSNEITGKDPTVEAKPDAILEAKLSWSLYSSACDKGSNPRNYRRRRDDGGNEIHGKDATVEAKPSSSRYPTAFIYFFDEAREEDAVLPVTITYDKTCSRELYSFTKEQYPAYPSSTVAAVSNVLPQAGSSGLIKPSRVQENLRWWDWVNQLDFLEKEKQPEGEFLSAPAPDAHRMIEEEQPEVEFLSAPAPSQGMIFNGVRMRRVSCRIGREGMIDTYSVGDEKPPPLQSRKRNEDLEEPLHKKRHVERFQGKGMYQGSQWTVSSDASLESWKRNIDLAELSRRKVHVETLERMYQELQMPFDPNQLPPPLQPAEMYYYRTGMPLGSMPNVSVPSSSGPATNLDTNPMPLVQQAELAKNESHAKTFSYLTAPLMSLAAREGSLSVPVDMFVFLQKLRDTNFIIRNFLQEKVSLIEKIEVQVKDFDEKHASAILERRTANDNDEMVELGFAVEAAMAVLNRQGNRNSAGFENKRASAMGIDGSNLEIEGESSTDESGSETSAYKEKRDALLQCADKVFSDASEVYSRLSRVRTRFKRWKRDNSSTYQDAYMSLDVPSIFSPYVRLELLKWDPLHQNVDFCDMKWHGLLFDNGKAEEGDDFAPDDTDANIVSELVEKVAIPILHHRIVRCWDILSTWETRNAVAATSLVKGYVSASSEALAELFAAIRARLVEGITAISVPTWDPLVLKAVPSARQAAAYRFGTSVRLMRNICMWKDILALPVLENLALNDLLFGKVLPHVRGIASEPNIHDAVTRTERIVTSLSGVWTGLRTDSRPLQPLVDCTLTLGRVLEKRLASGLDDAETIGLARRLKRILVQIHEHEHARAIVRTFNLEEAL